jgi:cytochrome c oxidase assembly protein subunit 15
MGGLRVNRISTAFAAAHGGFAQAFFGLMVALCVLTGRGWVSDGPARREPDPANLRRRALVTLILVYAQIAVGAWFRHFQTPAALWTHLAVAAAVWAHAAALSWRVARRRREVPRLWPSALAMAVVVTAQVLLGAAALWLMLPLGGNPHTPTLWQAMLRTAHQTNGALLLAATVVLTLRAFRHLGPSTETETTVREPAPRTVEAIA